MTKTLPPSLPTLRQQLQQAIAHYGQTDIQLRRALVHAEKALADRARLGPSTIDKPSGER
jgi:hypothetical protein